MSTEEGPYRSFAGEADITKLGEWSWNVQGLRVGVPLPPGADTTVRSSREGEEEGGFVVVKAGGSQLFSVIYFPGLYTDSYWQQSDGPSDPKQLLLSQALFGEKVAHHRLGVEAFSKTPEDLQCSQETRARDAQLIVMLLHKRATPARVALSAPGYYSLPVYRVKQSDWWGKYRCSPDDDGMSSISIIAYTSELVAQVFIRTEGSCPAIEQISAGPNED